MKTMKKLFALLLCLALLLALTGCGKSEYVKNAEALIDAIGEVTADSEEAIAAAEAAYNALTEDDKGKVENADVLPEARAALEIALEEKAAAELEALRQSLIGTWQARTEQIELLCSSVDTSLGDSRISFRDYLDSFPFAVTLELREDGSYHMYADSAAMAEFLPTLKAAVVRFYDDFLVINLSDLLEQEGYGSGLNSWAAIEGALGADRNTIITSSLGMTLEDFVDALFTETSLEELMGDVSQEGTYLVEPGKLHLSSDMDSEPKDGDYESFTLEGNTLTLLDFSSTSLFDGLVYPLEFQRIG